MPKSYSPSGKKILKRSPVEEAAVAAVKAALKSPSFPTTKSNTFLVTTGLDIVENLIEIGVVRVLPVKSETVFAGSVKVYSLLYSSPV